MTCQKCQKREATVHEHEQTEDGKGWTEVHLCDPCAGKTGLALLTPGGILQALMEGAAAATGAVAVGPACPDCGITWAEFKARGRFGCPRDYEVFEADLAPLLARLHQGRLEHVGKAPAGATPASPREQALAELRRALDEAVRREDYEEAARLRDRVRAGESASAETAPAGERPDAPARAGAPAASTAPDRQAATPAATAPTTRRRRKPRARPATPPEPPGPSDAAGPAAAGEDAP